jgi:hypothetical protein
MEEEVGKNRQKSGGIAVYRTSMVSEAFRTSGNVTARGGSQVPNEYFCLHYKN